jgi:hypothetical protein
MASHSPSPRAPKLEEWVSFFFLSSFKEFQVLDY